MKNHINLWGGVRRIGNWMSQNTKWLTICWVVIPTDSGIWFGMSRKDGQIARMHCVMAVDPVYVWMACQNKAVIIRTTTANRAKCQPNPDLSATGKGTWRRWPIAPLSTSGTVQTRLPKMMHTTDSRLVLHKIIRRRSWGTDIYQVSPTAIILAGASQLWAFRASENQYPPIVHAVQVRRSRGVTSVSILVLILTFSNLVVYR